ncbi:MAG: GCN5-related N-acetyltransferase [Pedosphaera sp.]|nr:GCN5-related N-acetyltransferase [Pedosphaera sp.]
MTMPELALRMKGWLSADYTAIVFEDASEVVAYALFREQSEEIHLRHLFVVPARRRMGIGRQALQILRLHFWPSSKRLTVDVLTSNKSAVAFWLAMGFSEYCMTLEILPDNKPGA